MKKIGLLLVAISLTFTSCNEEKKEVTNKEIAKEEMSIYTLYGDSITGDYAISKNAMLQKFKDLKPGDTIAVKFKATINKSCKKKGCWMRLDLGNDEESLVKFKDYGFFVPLNAAGKDVIVNGKAYIDLVTVAQLKHYAKDEGLSQEEIDKITEDEITFAVESNGVLLKE